MVISRIPQPGNQAQSKETVQARLLSVNFPIPIMAQQMLCFQPGWQVNLEIQSMVHVTCSFQEG
jgi:hypothetical protein